MEGNTILEMIKNKDSKSALKEMEHLYKKVLIDKLNEIEKVYTDLDELDFIVFLDFCIQNLREYYDILTHLRNLYFFAEKSDYEKLYEMAHIYEVISN